MGILKKRSLILACGLVFSAFWAAAQTGSSNLEFVENKGQWDKNVAFKADIGTGTFYLSKKGFTVLLHNPDELAAVRAYHHGVQTPDQSQLQKNNAISLNSEAPSEQVVHSHVYKVSFLGASDNVEIVPDKPLPSYNNYFIGNDPSKWATDCKVYQGITYKNIYPNIDLRYYSNNGIMKYDMIVHPGGNPDNIIMKYDGAEKLDIKRTELLIKTSIGTSKELTPTSYQLTNEGKSEVPCRFFKSSENTVRFKIKNYDPKATLVIDPTLVFCSFTGSLTTNWGFTATYGPDGSLFAGGIVDGLGFPVSPGAFQTSWKGGPNTGPWDIGILKFNPSGSQRVYATYLGGGSSDYPHSLVVDKQGNLVVFGRTSSVDFPTTAPTVGKGGGRDIFVTKFNAAGNGLIGSLRIGGTSDDGLNITDQGENGGSEVTQSLILNYGDWSRGEVILDGSNNIYVASCTQSSDFPIIGNVFQPKLAGGNAKQDGVIIKINPSCNGVIFSSFLGGSQDDAALVMDLNPITGDIYVGGCTLSPNFPGINPNVYQSSFKGGIDGFLSIISNDGSTLKGTTFFGNSGSTVIYGVKFDKLGFPYVMGTTTGSWSMVNAAWGNVGAKQFVAKLKQDLSSIVYTTTFGTPNAKSPNISPVAFLVDRCQNVYVSGWGSFYEYNGSSPDPYGLSGTAGMPVTPNAIKPTTDGRDFYFIVIKRDAAGLLYGTFFGQNDPPNKYASLSEHVDGGTSRYDQNGVIYQAICANCNTQPNIKFPTTPGVWAPLNGARANGGCNLAAVKIAFNFAGVSANLKSIINGRYDSTGCVPLEVTFVDTIKNAKSYIWNFGDGTPDSPATASTVVHTYNNVGNYLVRLIAIDSTSCNISDTVYLHIIGRTDKALLDFSAIKLPPCKSLDYQFVNNSVAPPNKPFTDSSFIWDFGDGTRVRTGTGTLNHSFTAAGTYKVRLVLVDTNYCNYPDSVVQLLSVSPLVKAQFVTPAAGCVPYTAYFENTSLGGQTYFWTFGDGSTSTEMSPSHLYPFVGTYTVSLTVIDSNTCNIIDSTKTTIIVSDKPHAAFTTSPIPPTPNTLTIFYNNSTDGVLYKWFFGDGDSVIKTTLDSVGHQYNASGTYEACLVVYNKYQCPDTVCQQVEAIVNPLLDVPNAFTPGRFGVNAVVGVKGFGINKMLFRIYNRWGQKLFESTDPNIGWDGTYKGALQPADVYVYTLQAELVNGSKVDRKGDITLIR
jgi:gliding motility-associated-like protein